MTPVVLIFDIGKTNKKLFLFNKNFEIVYQKFIRFEEVVDDDNYPCDDIEAIENWIKSEVDLIQSKGEFQIKAINFSTHGATLMYLDKNGNRVTPLYNYLKPLDFDFSSFYDTYGGKQKFSRKTASPAYGMLNSGLQMYWLKNTKPQHWEKVEAILHFPQYLSYLFSGEITSDFTSIGAHTAIWNFDDMTYHDWLAKENINLPQPKSGTEASMTTINGQQVAIGMGLHDSTSSIIPLLEESHGDKREFVLLSTGTWIITMNPFSKEVLTTEQLENDCLCYLTPDKKQIKSSMQFLGKVHEVNSEALAKHFDVLENHYLELELNKNLCKNLIQKNESTFFPHKIPDNWRGDFSNIDSFDTYEQAYYQLIYEITIRVCKAVNLILDTGSNLEIIYISGGFNKNKMFVEYLDLMLPKKEIIFTQSDNASALGAAMLMREYL